jgi:hypothetical protein
LQAETIAVHLEMMRKQLTRKKEMLRIKKLDIFIAKQFGLLFMGTFFICQFVLMMQFLWRYIDDLIGKGISMDVMAQFFWYMGLMLVPQALPLAILLSSLMTFGNLGESSELTAIKAAGISLMQAFRSLIVITVIIMFGSFYFQNNVGPHSNQKLAQLLISMKQKSPELEIPEGIFYDGIPNCNLYVQKKDMNTGKLYGIMIYRMTDSYEDAAIILADSGMLQSTAEKKHLVLSLYSGEWFENMKSSEFGNSAAVPYRRETFVSKKIVLDFDADFNLTDASSLCIFCIFRLFDDDLLAEDVAFDTETEQFHEEHLIHLHIEHRRVVGCLVGDEYGDWCQYGWSQSLTEPDGPGSQSRHSVARIVEDVEDDEHEYGDDDRESQSTLSDDGT